MSKDAPKRLAVAVQGGGAHGAFSWGALDRLLEEVQDGKLEIVALSGTSAGGFNATLCAYALGSTDGDRASRAKEARRILKDYWLADADVAPFSAYSSTATWWHKTFGSWNIDTTPAALMASVNNQLWSPAFYAQYDWLAQVLGDKIDFDKLRQQGDVPHLYIAATNITEGCRDIFTKSAVTLETLKASASIPQLFLPAHFDNTYYWDGGFMGNPPLRPLIYHATDVAIIQLNPFSRDKPPLTAMEINNRINEVTFNSSMILEINAIVAVNNVIKYLQEKSAKDSALKEALKLLPVNPVNLYSITNEDYLRTLGYASKAVIVREFLEELHEEGRKAADKWLHSESYRSVSATDLPVPRLPDAQHVDGIFPGDVLDRQLKNYIRGPKEIPPKTPQGDYSGMTVAAK
ncbi:alpha/beta hydrolase [Paraburkholderia terrae]|uniref:Alpha/beta hydrolase n=1 Tax=Paraburkholderia terrae TaxID=311230 RepID=A0ABN6JLI7_9BURK|nr:patatin-like phospholipase family protein [Paraburkholderia terrae]BCZ81769.1 alpha/beta hydrolase [Paraburkholderia terrae]